MTQSKDTFYLIREFIGHWLFPPLHVRGFSDEPDTVYPDECQRYNCSWCQRMWEHPSWLI